MIQSPIRESSPVLIERLERGARLLFEMEQRGDLGPEYQRWLQRWEDLLIEYEREDAA